MGWEEGGEDMCWFVFLGGGAMVMDGVWVGGWTVVVFGCVCVCSCVSSNHHHHHHHHHHLFKKQTNTLAAPHPTHLFFNAPLSPHQKQHHHQVA